MRARTILAACRRVTLHLPDLDEVTGDRSQEVVAGFLPWRGSLYLLVAPGRPAPSGTVRLTCSGPQDVGVLVLSGRCGVSLAGTAIPDLAEALFDRGECTCADDGPELTPWGLARMVVIPLIVEGVRVIAGPRHPGRRSLPVPLELFHRARADLWAVHRDDIVDHLERHHQEELRRLVQALAGPLGASGVAVRDLGPHGLVLTCLTPDGVTDLVIPFEPPVEQPSDLGAWLRDVIRPPDGTASKAL